MKKLFALLTIVSMIFPTLTSQVYAQEKTKVAIVQLVSHPSLDEIVDGIYASLEEEGYDKDKLEVDFHNAQGDMNLLTTINDTVLNNQPDLIFAVTTPVAQALAEKTDQVPIILAGITDPVGAKLVDSLEKPNTNITGVTDAVPFDKQFELIKKIAPQIKKIGMLYTTSEDNSLLEMQAAKEVAEEMGYEVVLQGLDSTIDMPMVAESLADKVDAIFVGADNTIASAFESLLDIADEKKVPVFTTIDTFVKQGALSAVAMNQKEIGLQAGKVAHDILQGADIQTYAVQSVENLKAVYNSKTLELLGLEIDDQVAKDLEDLAKE